MIAIPCYEIRTHGHDWLGLLNAVSAGLRKRFRLELGIGAYLRPPLYMNDGIVSYKYLCSVL